MKHPAPGQIGAVAEDRAAEFLQAQGLRLLQRNFRCRLGEIDLIMQDGAELVFVEVRWRSSPGYGSAVETIGPRKRQRVIRAAGLYLQRYPAAARGSCRFDVVALDGPRLQWLRGAFGTTD